MPFTLAHPAVVLPLLRSPFVPVALIAGAMAPDAPYFLTTAGITSTRAGDWYGPFLNATTTHSLGGVPIDLFYTAVLIAAYWLLRAPITALGATLPRIGRPNPLWLVVSAAIGVASHLLWDYLTEADFIPAPRLLQYLSTTVGVIVVGWFIWKRRQQLSTPDATTPRLDLTTRRVVLAVLIGVPLLAAVVLAPGDLAGYAEAGSSAAGIAEGVATGAVKRFGAAFAVALLLYAAASWTSTLVRGRRSVGPT